MNYYCKGCSYRGKTSGSGGECPACGSFNLTRGGKTEEQPTPAKWRLVLLIGLWSYLIIMIIWKLLH